MRIISGSARGVQLAAPKGRDVRPTLDRVRESVFNILAPELDGDSVVFADLYCGTGANGLEALSRGASKAVLVDSQATALECARKNATKAKLSDRAVFIRVSLPARLETALNLHGPLNVVYADPPFDSGDHERLLTAIAEAAILAPEGIVIIEHSSRRDTPKSVPGLSRYRQEHYGETMVSFYRRDAG